MQSFFSYISSVNIAKSLAKIWSWVQSLSWSWSATVPIFGAAGQIIWSTSRCSPSLFLYFQDIGLLGQLRPFFHDHIPSTPPTHPAPLCTLSRTFCMPAGLNNPMPCREVLLPRHHLSVCHPSSTCWCNPGWISHRMHGRISSQLSSCNSLIASLCDHAGPLCAVE